MIASDPVAFNTIIGQLAPCKSPNLHKCSLLLHNNGTLIESKLSLIAHNPESSDLFEIGGGLGTQMKPKHLRISVLKMTSASRCSNRNKTLLSYFDAVPDKLVIKGIKCGFTTGNQ